MFNKLVNKKSGKSANVSQPLMFLVGGALGAVGTYLFATEKGAASRKQLAEKANKLSENVTAYASSVKDKWAYAKNGTEQSAEKESENGIAPTDTQTEEEAPVLTKAQSMVNHLKHTKTNTNNEPS